MKKATIAKLLVVCLIVGMMGMSIAATTAPAPQAADGWVDRVYTLSEDASLTATLTDGAYRINLGANKLTGGKLTVNKGATLNVYSTEGGAELLFSAKGKVEITVREASYTNANTYEVDASVKLFSGSEFKCLEGAADGVKVSNAKKGEPVDGYITWTYKSSGGGGGGGGSSTPVKPTDPTDPTDPTKPAFTDVAADAYYADAVAWAIEKGITVGLTDTTFGPDASCTRGQMVTFLWRLAGSPKAAGTNPFGDVSADSYFYDAVMWAVSKGITSGTAEDAFSPDATVNRAQSVTFLYRYAGSPAVEGSNAFADVAADDYFANAVAWAAANGITVGTTDTTFSPDNACVRGQIVTFMYRYAGEK